MHHFGILPKVLLVWAAAIIQSGQGTALHGTGIYESINIPLRASPPGGSPSCSVWLKQGVLIWGDGCRARSSGEALEGGDFMAPFNGREVTFTVTAHKEHRSIVKNKDGTDYRGLSAPPRFEYTVKVANVSICKGNALAVPFGWSTSGELLDDPQFFTFACIPTDGSPGGVIAKCVDWGYAPWALTPPAPLPNQLGNLQSYDDATARRFHQTCVRMATADYCGEGHSNTLDDTPIGIADVTNLFEAGLATKTGRAGSERVHFKERDLQTGQSAATTDGNDGGVPAFPGLEGVWGIDGCGRARILCLSKARWDTLSLSATCVDKVMARRTAYPSSGGPGCISPNGISFGQLCSNLVARPEHDDHSGPYSGWTVAPTYIPVEALALAPPGICDEWTLADFNKQGATLVSYSENWDSPLVSFADGASGHRLTTTAVKNPHDNPALPDDTFGYTLEDTMLAPSFHQEKYEGRIFKPSTPPSFLTAHALIPLYRCKNAHGDYLTTTSLALGQRCESWDSPDPYLIDRLEGFIFNTPPEGVDKSPLWFSKSNEGHPQYVTSTAEPGQNKRIVQLGWVMLKSPQAYQATDVLVAAEERLVDHHLYSAARAGLPTAEEALGLTATDRARLHLVDAILLSEERNVAGARRAIADALSLDRTVAFVVVAPPTLREQLEEIRQQLPTGPVPLPLAAEAALREPGVKALLRLVDVLFKRLQFEGAAAVLHLAVQVDSPSAEERGQSALRRGLLRLEANDEVEARRAFQEALEVDRTAQLPEYASAKARRLLEELRTAASHAWEPWLDVWLGAGGDYIPDTQSIDQLDLTLSVGWALNRYFTLGGRAGGLITPAGVITGIPLDLELRATLGPLYLGALAGPWVMFEDPSQVRLHGALELGLNLGPLSIGGEVALLSLVNTAGLRVALRFF